MPDLPRCCQVNFSILRESIHPEKVIKCILCGQGGHDASECKGEARQKKGEHGELMDDEPPPTPMQFLHVSILREYLAKEFATMDAACVGGIDLERVIDDFVLMCFFVGNDFLPHIPSLEIREGAISTIVQLYKVGAGAGLCNGGADGDGDAADDDGAFLKGQQK